MLRLVLVTLLITIIAVPVASQEAGNEPTVRAEGLEWEDCQTEQLQWQGRATQLLGDMVRPLPRRDA